VCRGRSVPGAPKVVLGPGTGLGAAALVRDRSGQAVVVSSEVGHMALAAGSMLELEILRLLKSRGGHIAIEDLVSGSGLPRLYALIARVRGQGSEELSANMISERALAGTDEI